MLGGVYALIFAEVFLRIFLPQAMLPRFITATEWGIRGNIPNSTYRHQTPEVDVMLRVNAQGMRDDRHFDITPPANVCRIALLGDSYFMGYEADLEDVIAQLLEDRLAAAGYQVQALNFAVSGFSTAEMIIQFEENARRYKPTVTVFQVHASDFNENITAPLFEPDGQGGLVRTGASYLPGVAIRDKLMASGAYRWLIQNSHIYTAIRERAALQVKQMLRMLAFTGDDVWGLFAPNPATAEKVDPAEAAAQLQQQLAPWTAALLRHARLVTEQAGSAWIAFEIPTFSSRMAFGSLRNRFEGQTQILERYVSPIDVFQAAAEPDVKIYFEQGHRHLTPKGAGLAADVLAAAILEKESARFEGCRL